MVEARQKFSAAVKRTSVGIVVAMGVYLATNPYLLINALTNREVLASNFGNSFAMYEISRIGEGFLRVFELTVEGATLPIVILGVVALMVAVARRNSSIIALSVPAAVFFLQFVMIGAGKPAEYGRFGIFTNAALAVGAAGLLARRWTRLREIVNWVPATFVVIWVGFFGAQYLRNFHADTADDGTRLQLARGLSHEASAQVRWTVGVTKEPAPYCCPPLDFSNTAVSLVNSADQFIGPMDQGRRFLATTDRCEPWADDTEHDVSPAVNRQERSWWIEVDTPISWANKPFRSIGDRVIGGDPEVRTPSVKNQLGAPHDEQ
jgi:hypothetical protein